MTLSGHSSTSPAAAMPLMLRPRAEKIAVFRALQLGDMLCSVPALRALRATFPHAQITLVGLPWAEQFARRFRAYVDDFIAFPGHPSLPEQAVREELVASFYRTMRQRRFDLALQLHGSGQISNAIVREFGARETGGFTIAGTKEQDEELFVEYPEHGAEPQRLLHLAQHLGAPSPSADLEFPLTEEDERELRDAGVGNSLAPGRYICIHPGARMRHRCWPPQLFAQIADTLAREYGLPIVLTGAGNEVDLTTAIAECMQTPAINAAAPISIGAMAALLNKARLLVCNDTGVSHIAAGLTLPSVVVFGASDMERWGPVDRSLHRCIRGEEGAAAILAQARDLLSATGYKTAPAPAQSLR